MRDNYDSSGRPPGSTPRSSGFAALELGRELSRSQRGGLIVRVGLGLTLALGLGCHGDGVASSGWTEGNTEGGIGGGSSAGESSTSTVTGGPAGDAPLADLVFFTPEAALRGVELTGAEVFSYPSIENEAVYRTSFSPDGTLMAISVEGAVDLVSLEEGDRWQLVETGTFMVTDLEWSPTGDRIAAEATLLSPQAGKQLILIDPDDGGLTVLRVRAGREAW